MRCRSVDQASEMRGVKTTKSALRVWSRDVQDKDTSVAERMNEEGKALACDSIKSQRTQTT
jgi:hypothetical protein